MSASSFFKSILLPLIICGQNVEADKCPLSQTPHTHQVCNIFQFTNMQDRIAHNLSDDNYCNWGYTTHNQRAVGCGSSTDTAILGIDFDRHNGLYLSGTLDFSSPWPPTLSILDLEGDYSASATKLSGEFDWKSIESLHSLTKINLNNNEFTGAITNQDWNNIAALQSFKYLYIAKNNFETDFSDIEINSNSVSKIQVLGLDTNNFYGSMNVNTDGFFGSFPDLKYFWISSNDIYGHFNNLDSISTNYLPNLTQFSLSNNKYSGAISLSNGLSLSPELNLFSVYNNNFDGSVQWNMFSSRPKFYYINLALNSFSGSINPLFLPSTMQTIYLDQNAFSGSIEWDIFSNLTQLKVIDVGNNELSGSLSMSNGLTFPSSLKRIELDWNHFNGSIDWNIFNKDVNSLIEIDLDHNEFSGSINPLSFPKSVQYLYFDSNEFSGSVQWDIYSNLTAIKVIDFGDNLLHGGLSMSNNLSFPASLERIEIDYNSFNETVDWNVFNNATNLIEIDLDHNAFSGSINPVSLPKSIKYLYFDNNQFSGSVPWDVFSDTSLINLDFGENNLHGSVSMTNGLSFPESLSKIDIERNNFNGTVDWNVFNGCSNLYEIDFEKNAFTGTVDWDIFMELTKLKRLELQYNAFSGSINTVLLPDSLQYIYAHSNTFSGSIPWDIFSNLYDLQVLDIGENQFHGELSMSNGLLFPTTLQRLEIDNNNFNGTVDWNVFSNAYNLFEIDMDNNAFTGTIDWDIISNLHQQGKLTNIHLGGNTFTGYIDFSWITKPVSLYVDNTINCDPIIYPRCQQWQKQRKSEWCSDKASCEATCNCAPTLSPTAEPTPAPTNNPTLSPTDNPTPSPTSVPTKDPTSNPSKAPTSSPTIAPSISPTHSPTFTPIVSPTKSPSINPTIDPTSDPTSDPTFLPSIHPTQQPTVKPSIRPTSDPTIVPTKDPTVRPTFIPTIDPTTDPTFDPTADPTSEPTTDPTIDPTIQPTLYPTSNPTPSDTIIVDKLVDGNNDSDGVHIAVNTRVPIWHILLILLIIGFCFCCCCVLFILYLRRWKRKALRKYQQDVINMAQLQNNKNNSPISGTSPTVVTTTPISVSCGNILHENNEGDVQTQQLNVVNTTNEVMPRESRSVYMQTILDDIMKQDNINNNIIRNKLETLQCNVSKGKNIDRALDIIAGDDQENVSDDEVVIQMQPETDGNSTGNTLTVHNTANVVMESNQRRPSMLDKLI